MGLKMFKKFSTTASGAYVLLLWCAYWNTSYISHKHCKTTQALFVPFGWKFFHNTAKLIFHGYLYISIYNLVCYYSYHVTFDLF